MPCTRALSGIAGGEAPILVMALQSTRGLPSCPTHSTRFGQAHDLRQRIGRPSATLHWHLQNTRLDDSCKPQRHALRAGPERHAWGRGICCADM
eukprot:980413-Pyramimonas_sp.AAC.1